MAEEEQPDAGAGAEPKGRGRKPLVIGAAAMVLCGAAAFAAVSIMGGDATDSAEEHAKAEGATEDHGGDSGQGEGGYAASDVAFVPVEPLTVMLDPGGARSYLRFTSHLEVPYGRQEEVAALMPRIMDALGGYLRAIDPATLADRDATLRMRGQMLRRVRLVVGPDAVHDLLVTEFVLN